MLKPRVLLYLEGAVVFAASLYVYAALHAPWRLYFLLFLAPISSCSVIW